MFVAEAFDVDAATARHRGYAAPPCQAGPPTQPI
jgi:hypothetical protein